MRAQSVVACPGLPGFDTAKKPVPREQPHVQLKKVVPESVIILQNLDTRSFNMGGQIWRKPHLQKVQHGMHADRSWAKKNW